VKAARPLPFRRGWLRDSRGGCVPGLLLFVIATLTFARPCLASQLMAVSAGTPDTTLNGSTVSEPKTPSAAMFSNPAGLTSFDKTTVDVPFALSFARTKVEASAPSTYADTNDPLVLSPGVGLAVPIKGPWHFGFALYGNVGNKFDFDADPAAGVDDDFLSEAGVFTFGASLAYRFSDRLSLGAAITPLLGRVRMDFTANTTPFDFKLIGPGVQGILGLRWEPLDGLAVGLGVRTPGKVWMDGSMPLGSGRQDIDLELKMPAQVFAGLTTHLGRRIVVSLAVRWSDTSCFGDSLLEFELTPDASTPFVPGARDEWLVSAGVEYVWNDLLTLRLGAGHANSVVGDEGVSPLLFDTDDYRLAAGFGLNFDRWSLDFMAAHAFAGTRKIGADQPMSIPGRYSISGQIMMIGITWRL
jgi:long-subunit fatty acid transport protein